MKKKNKQMFINLADDLRICGIIIENQQRELEELRHPIIVMNTLVSSEDTTEPKDPGPKVIRPGGVEVKTVGQLTDELSILNIRIWMLIDKVMAGTATPEESQSVQVNNAKRNEYVRAIDKLLNQADIGGKVYDR
jgi:hypothetical protein